MEKVKEGLLVDFHSWLEKKTDFSYTSKEPHPANATASKTKQESFFTKLILAKIIKAYRFQ